MNAINTARRSREFEPIEVLEADAEFFRHPDRFHWIRLATPAEIKVVQERARRLKSPASAARCWRWSVASTGCRQRVVGEGWAMGDLAAWGEDATAKLFRAVTENGWVEIEGRAG